MTQARCACPAIDGPVKIEGADAEMQKLFAQLAKRRGSVDAPEVKHERNNLPARSRAQLFLLEGPALATLTDVRDGYVIYFAGVRHYVPEP